MGLLSILKALALIGLLVVCHSIVDPHNIFCGSNDCYSLLNVPRNATVSDIRRNYRGLSLEYHPDKNLNNKVESQKKFEKIAKAYEVLTNSTLREEFNFHLDHPDAYWEKYGSHVVWKYAPESDVTAVLIGLMLLWCIFAPAIQYSKYQRAVNHIIKAAENNWGVGKGGSAVTAAVRKEAEETLAARKAAEEGGTGANGTTGLSKAQIKARERAAEKAGGKKLTKEEKKEQMKQELSSIIAELAYKVDIQGGHRKPTWRDLPPVWLAQAPYYIGRWALYSMNWSRCVRWSMGTLSAADINYWCAREVGWDAWNDASEEARKEGIKSEIYKDREEASIWKAVYLHGADRAGIKKKAKKGGAIGIPKIDLSDDESEGVNSG